VRGARNCVFAHTGCLQEGNGPARNLYESLGYQRIWTRDVPATRISQVSLPPPPPPSLPACIPLSLPLAGGRHKVGPGVHVLTLDADLSQDGKGGSLTMERVSTLAMAKAL